MQQKPRIRVIVWVAGIFLFVLLSGSLTVKAATDWSDDFDSYATGVSLHGMGGWKGWLNDPAFTAFTTAAQARSAPNSVDIAGSADLVHEYSGYTSGAWVYTAYQYVPGNMTGLSYFTLLNQYDDAGATNNWSTQLNFDSNTGLVTADFSGASLPLITDQWVEIRVEIDLENNLQSIYYDGALLHTGSWSEGVSGGGIVAIGAVNLYANDASSVYYDDMSLVEAVIESAPEIEINPTTLSSTLPIDGSETQVLNVGNIGDLPLTWNIFEDGGTRHPNGGGWSEDFDSYATGVSLHGMGGWKGWLNDPAFTAFTTAAQARSAPNSVDIAGSADLVHEYNGYTSGAWVYTAYQYVPGNMIGTSYFTLLNQYDDAGATNNWSTQLNFDSNTGLVTADFSGASLPLITDQWVEIRIEIDLDNNVQSIYYDGALLHTGSWSEGVSGGGIVAIGAVNLYANDASSVYYDDMSLVEPVPEPCSLSSDIPWASVAPTSGTTNGGNSTPVDVMFDATGLSEGTYNGTLCIESNDPETPLVEVQVQLSVEGPTAIEMGDMSTAFNADGSVTINWSTTAETRNAGFNIYRSLSPDLMGDMLNNELIASTASAGAGASYSYVDASIGVGTFYYWVEAVDIDGATAAYGPIEAVTQAPTSTSLTQFGSNNTLVLPILVAGLASSIIMFVLYHRREA